MMGLGVCDPMHGGDGLSDVMYTLGYLFSGGPPPPAPFPTCEVDPTEDVNSCESHGGC